MDGAKNGPLKESLLMLEGDDWRKVRNTVSPTFSNFKMKQVRIELGLVERDGNNYGNKTDSLSSFNLTFIQGGP